MKRDVGREGRGSVREREKKIVHVREGIKAVHVTCVVLMKAKALNTGNHARFIRAPSSWQCRQQAVITQTSASQTGSHAVILPNLGSRLGGGL